MKLKIELTRNVKTLFITSILSLMFLTAHSQPKQIGFPNLSVSNKQFPKTPAAYVTNKIATVFGTADIIGHADTLHIILYADTTKTPKNYTDGLKTVDTASVVLPDTTRVNFKYDFSRMPVGRYIFKIVLKGTASVQVFAQGVVIKVNASTEFDVGGIIKTNPSTLNVGDSAIVKVAAVAPYMFTFYYRVDSCEYLANGLPVFQVVDEECAFNSDWCAKYFKTNIAKTYVFKRQLQFEDKEEYSSGVAVSTLYDYDTITVKSGSSGLSDASTKNRTLSVYPNPAGSVLNLGEVVEYSIYTVNGVAMISGSGDSVDVSGLRAGVYLIRGANKNGTFNAKFFKH